VVLSKRVRADGFNIYSGSSDLFNEIKGDDVRIGYKDGQFKAFDAKEIEDGWMFLDNVDGNFDAGVVKIKDNKQADKSEIPIFTGDNVKEPDVASEEDKQAEDKKNLKKWAISQYNMLGNDMIELAGIENRNKLIDNLPYQILYAIAKMNGFDPKVDGGKRINAIKTYLKAWKPEK
jgi:hypothetical protein